MLLRWVGVALLVGVLAAPGLVEAAPHGGGGGHAGGGAHAGFSHGGFSHGGFEHHGFEHGGFGYGGYGYGGYGYGGLYGGYALYPYGYGSGYYPYRYGAYPYLTSPYYLSGGVSYPYLTGPAYVPPTLPSDFTPYADAVPPTQPGGLTTANYQSETPAEVVVRVPANADVWIEGDKTQQTGPTRVFQSPPLESGRTFHYQVKARWMDNGKPVEVERKVPVHAGERSVVDFLKPPA